MASNKAVGLNYTYDQFMNRTEDLLKDGFLSPSDAGPSWEGIFTVPVCDISGAIPQKNWPKKKVILQPFGKGKIPQWCRPVCTNSSGQTDAALTLQFLDAAKMTNFKSPTHYCPNGAWTGWG